MIYLASLTEEIEDKVEGYYIIKSKEEMDRVVADNKNSNRLIIRRDFAKEYFTPTGLNNYIRNAKRVNRSLVIELDKKSDVLTQDRFIEKMANVKNMLEMNMLLARYPKEFMDAVKELTAAHTERRDELLEASATVSRLQQTIDELRFENDNIQHMLEMEQMNKFNTQSKLNVLVKRINYQYNAGVDESKLFDVNTNRFDKIIYIKEITRVQFVDSLIYYLKEIFKLLYNMPTRQLTIENYYAYGKVRLYPNLVPHFKLKEIDVLSGDILMLGMQPKLMEDILCNPNNISILIVLDRGGYGTPHIRGNNVEYFYTASDLADIPETVPRSRIISYDESTLFIPLIENFDKLDAGERISKYSSLEIIKRIVALIEGR